MRGVLGLIACVALAFGLSENRAAVRWRPVLAGLALQAGLAVLLIRLPVSRAVLLALDRGASAFQAATDAGDALVFGYLGGAAPPFTLDGPGSAYILAFRGLPLVLTISAFSALLYYWGILPRILGLLAWLLRRATGVSGPLSLAAAAHIFVGMTEAPLLIRPHLARMQRGEIFAMMSCGMAGVAGTVMLIYATMLGKILGDALGQILVASVLSTPAAVAVAALMVPFTSAPEPAAVAPDEQAGPLSALDALVQGAMAGLPVLSGIVVMLIVAVASVHLVNGMLGLLPGGDWSLQRIVAWPMRPLLWLIGVPSAEVRPAAALMATKTVLNEFVAYLALARAGPGSFDPRTRLILTTALCGFANFGSVGILVGGLGPMLPPERRGEVVRLGLRSLVSGTLATCMSGAWVGMLAR